MLDKNWQFELEEYIKQGEPERAEKSEAWQTAIGLQAVDGLKTSEYLLDRLFCVKFWSFRPRDSSPNYRNFQLCNLQHILLES